MGASRRRGPLGNPWSSLTGYFKRYLKGSVKGASLSVGDLLGGGFFLGIWKHMGRRAQGTDITPWGSIHRELWEIAVRGLWKWGISLYRSSVRGTWKGGSFARGPEGYERKDLEMGIPLYGGSVGQPGVDSSTGNFEIWLKGLGALGLWGPVPIRNQSISSRDKGNSCQSEFFFKKTRAADKHTWSTSRAQQRTNYVIHNLLYVTQASPCVYWIYIKPWWPPQELK